MRFDEGTLQAIRDRVSMVDLVGRYVELRRSGKNWKGLCPFHDERTPSFVVNDERGFYHCFGCGAGGDLFRFVMEMEGLGFPEAVERLAREAGVPLARGPAESRPARDEKARLLAVLDLAARYFRYQLTSGRAGEQARAYLERRGVGPELAERFGLGYAPRGWDPLARFLKSRGWDLGVAERAGLVRAREGGGVYDRFRDRIMFPIHDASGRVVGFGGRVIGEGEPKYLNGPETPVFQKRRLLYGLYQSAEALRRNREAWVVEGYLDVISLHGRGHARAVATLGTALGPEHLRELRRRADRVVLLYDGDEAGRRAALRSLDVFLAEGMDCRAVFLPPGHDPDSFVRESGDLESEVRKAPPLFDLFLEDVVRGTDRSSVPARLRAADRVGALLAKVADPLARDLYARRAAEALEVDEARLRQRARTRAKRGDEPAEGPAPPAEDPLERAVVACLVHRPRTREPFRQEGMEEWLAPGPLRDAARWVAEQAEELRLTAAPEAVRSLVARLAVEEGAFPEFGELVRRLRLRAARREAARVLRRLRAAEKAGDAGAVETCLRRKAELDQEIARLQG
ncbi:DNA primase [Deferrisoma palaeochoriense]